MAFTTYNVINAPHKPQHKVSGHPTLFMSTNGVFRLSMKAGQILKLDKDSDKVEFLQDTAYPTDWYIQKADNKFGFSLKPDTKGCRVFYSSTLKDLILKTVVKDETLQFRNILFALVPSNGKLAICTQGYRVSSTYKKRQLNG